MISGSRPIACGTHSSPLRSTLVSHCEMFAWDEGEGDRSREFWLDAHTTAFTRGFAVAGRQDEMHPDIAVVFERFELL